MNFKFKETDFFVDLFLIILMSVAYYCYAYVFMRVLESVGW